MAWSNEGAAEAPREPGQVPTQSMILAEKLEGLDKGLAQLSLRLASVTRPSEPTPEPNEKLATVGPVQAPLAEELGKHILRVLAMQDRVSSLLTRLELS